MYISKINSLNYSQPLNFKADEVSPENMVSLNDSDNEPINVDSHINDKAEDADTFVPEKGPQSVAVMTEEDEAVEAVKAFAGYSDEKLMQIASEKPDKEFFKTAKDLTKTFFIGVPLIDVAAETIQKRGALSSKMSAAAKRTGYWGAVLAVVASFAIIKNRINDKSPEMRNIQENHPVLAFGMDAAAVFGGLGILNIGKHALKLYAKENHASLISKFKNSVMKPLKSALNSSAINKKLIIPAEKAIYKSPKGYVRAGLIALTMLAPAVAISAVIKGECESNRREKAVNNNFRLLSEARNIARTEFAGEE